MLPIITIIAALIAVWQTHNQIKLSNKRFLFDKRQSKYLLAKGLLELYNDNESLLDYTGDPDDEAIIVDYQFINLTNNNYLKDVTCIINEPKYSELQKDYGELKHRYRLYDAIGDLKKSYRKVVSKRVINKIEKSIKL